MVHKILSINKILISIKDHNCCSVIQIYILSISMHIQNLIEIYKLIHKILSINKILMSIKGHNSVKNWPKLTCIRYNMDLVRGVIDKFVSFFHRIIIYGWSNIIFCHYQQQSLVNQKKTLKCKEWQTFDVTMTLMTSHVGDAVVKTLEDRYGWCTLSGYKCYSTGAIVVKFSDNICT